MDDLTHDEEILSTYKAAFNADGIKKEDLTQLIKIPLRNIEILAYLYYSDFQGGKKPVMHDSPYISKYRKKYAEKLKSCLPEDIIYRLL